MERILSKDEISELLSAVREGEVGQETTEPAASAAEAHRGAMPLDLIQQSYAAGRLRIGNLDIILDAFARNASISLTQRLQRSVLVKRIEVESLQFDPLLQTLKEHGAIGIIRLDPLKHGGLFIFNGPLAYFFIENMLGGQTGSEPVILDRPMTPIETNIIKTVIETSCLDLVKAFRPLITLESSLVRIDVDPRMVNIVPPETEMMTARFSISADNESVGVSTLSIPYPSLEPLREKLKKRVEDISSDQTSWLDIIREVLPRFEMNITAQSGEIKLSIRKILNMKKGDIVPLNYDPDSPLRILVEDRPKFLASPGVHKGKKAIRITSRIN